MTSANTNNTEQAAQERTSALAAAYAEAVAAADAAEDEDDVDKWEDKLVLPGSLDEKDIEEVLSAFQGHLEDVIGVLIFCLFVREYEADSAKGDDNSYVCAEHGLIACGELSAKIREFFIGKAREELLLHREQLEKGEEEILAKLGLMTEENRKEQSGRKDIVAFENDIGSRHVGFDIKEPAQIVPFLRENLATAHGVIVYGHFVRDEEGKDETHPIVTGQSYILGTILSVFIQDFLTAAEEAVRNLPPVPDDPDTGSAGV